MPSILGSDIVSQLVATADGIRGSINSNFGVRSHKSFVVLRTYNNANRSGSFVDAATELLPPPRVTFLPSSEFKMLGTGKYNSGGIKIDQISLTYSIDQLYTQGLQEYNELYIRLVCLHGEGMPEREFVLRKPPIIDRNNSIGWIIEAEERQLRNNTIVGTLR